MNCRGELELPTFYSLLSKTKEQELNFKYLFYFFVAVYHITTEFRSPSAFIMHAFVPVNIAAYM
jgi:hypothetical protein